MTDTVYTTEYEHMLSNAKWHDMRLQVLKRDGYMCRSCGTTQMLQVHHRQYHRLKRNGQFLEPWKYHARYLVTLCKKCHQAGHGQYKVPVFYI